MQRYEVEKGGWKLSDSYFEGGYCQAHVNALCRDWSDSRTSRRVSCILLMSPAMASEIVLSYRHLYRHGLRAVQFSKPARYTLRDRLRTAFRKGNPRDFDQRKIDNTIEFLRGAIRETGLEHRIVKNIIFVWFHQVGPKPTRPKT